MRSRIRLAQIICVPVFALLLMGASWDSTSISPTKTSSASLGRTSPPTTLLATLDASSLLRSPTTSAPLRDGQVMVSLKHRAYLTALKEGMDAAASIQAAQEAQQAARAASQAQQSYTATAAPSITAGSSSSIWDCIIAHESGGDPTAANPSSTASGLFQFLDSSWAGYGGGQYASRAMYATVAQQWAIAEAAQAQSGWYPWRGDGCTPVG